MELWEALWYAHVNAFLQSGDGERRIDVELHFVHTTTTYNSKVESD